MLFKLTFATLILATVSTTTFAKNKPVGIDDQMQAACADDAKRLCGEFIPDIDKTTACMKPKKSQVSAACAAFYK